MSEQYKPKIGDLVLSKMPSYPYWPALIIPETHAAGAKPSKGDHYLCLYLNDRSQYWCNATSLKPFDFEDAEKQLKKKSLNKLLREAYTIGLTKPTIESFLKSNPLKAGDASDDDDDGMDVDDDDQDVNDEDPEINDEEDDGDEKEVIKPKAKSRKAAKSKSKKAVTEEEDKPSTKKRFKSQSKSSSKKQKTTSAEPDPELEPESESSKSDIAKSDASKSAKSKKTTQVSTSKSPTPRSDKRGKFLTPPNEQPSSATPQPEKLTEDDLFKQLWHCRSKLQKGLIQRNDNLPPSASDLALARTILDKLENFPITLNLMKRSRINKVIKALTKLDQLREVDGYSYHDKCNLILEKWSPLIADMRGSARVESPALNHDSKNSKGDQKEQEEFKEDFNVLKDGSRTEQNSEDNKDDEKSKVTPKQEDARNGEKNGQIEGNGSGDQLKKDDIENVNGNSEDNGNANSTTTTTAITDNRKTKKEDDI